EAHQARQEDFGRLAPLVHGAAELTGKDFQFRGVRYHAPDAGPLLEQIKNELDQDFDWMGVLDRQVFLVHHAMARQIGEAVRAELEERYRFHLALQAIHSLLTARQGDVNATLSNLAGRHELADHEFEATLAILSEAHGALGDAIKAAGSLHL